MDTHQHHKLRRHAQAAKSAKRHSLFVGWLTSLTAPLLGIVILLLSGSLVFAQDSTSAGSKIYLPVISSGSEVSTAQDEPPYPDTYDSQQEPVLDEGENTGRLLCLLVSVKITNQSSYPVKVYWVNLFGGESLYKTLNPNSYYWQVSSLGNRWRVRSTTGILLNEFTVSCFNSYVTITNNNFPPTPTNTPVPPTATPTPVPVVNIDTNATYKIVSNSSGKLLSANPNQAAADGQKVVLFSDVNAPSQLWRFVSAGGGYYSIVSLQTGRALDVNNSSQTAGEPLQLWTLNNGTNQQWRVLGIAGTDYLNISARHSGQYIDVNGGGSADLTPVIQWPANGQTNQQWKLVPVTVAPTATPTNTMVPPTATATNTPVPQLGSLGNQVWFDLNGNGTQQLDEPYVPGVTVELLQGCLGNTVLDTQVTDGNGFYTFFGLVSAQYRVRFSNLPAGYQFTAKDVGLADNIDSDVNPDGTTDCLTLMPGEDYPFEDAGIVSTANTNTINGKAWYDSNQNGILENSEAPVLDVLMLLYSGCVDTTSIVDSKVTDLDGLYTFASVADGTYRVAAVQDANFPISPKDQTVDTLDSDFDPTTGLSDCITLNANKTVSLDIGFIPVN